MKTQKRNKLPLTPSKLVAIARRDLIAVRRMRRYKVDMSLWHSPLHTNEAIPTPLPVTAAAPCSVCQAGAVMARTLGVDINAEAMPEEFDSTTKQQLYSLNRLRKGYVGGFLQVLAEQGSKATRKWLDRHPDTDSVYFEPNLGNVSYMPYAVNPEDYLKWLKALEKWLIAEGI